MKKKKSLEKNNFHESLEFIKECKNPIYLSILLFITFVIFGFLFPPPEQISEQLLKIISELLKNTENLSQFGLIAYIFSNNVQSSFFSMIFGVFLGIFPAVTAIFNGYFVGFVASLGVKESGFSILLRLLPHGIFELPAIFISLGMGLKIASFVLEKNKIESLKEYTKKSLITFILIVIPLLIIAAIIEGSLIYLSG